MAPPRKTYIGHRGAFDGGISCVSGAVSSTLANDSACRSIASTASLAAARAASSNRLAADSTARATRRAAPRASSTADESASRVCGNSAASGA